MDKKFIGLEGFNRIESIKTSKKKIEKLNTAQKTVRFVRRASVFIAKEMSKSFKRFCAKTADRINKQNKLRKKRASVIDRCYSENRKGNASEQSISVLKLISEAKPAEVRKYAHSAPAKAQKSPRKSIKKKAVLASVSCLTAIMLSCITVVSAVEAEKTAPIPALSTETVPVATQGIDTAPEFISEDTGITYNPVVTATPDEASLLALSKANIDSVLVSQPCALYVDGELIGLTTESEQLRAQLDKFLADYRKDYDEGTTTVFANDVKVIPVKNTKLKYMTALELVKAAKDKFSVALSTDIWYDVTLEHETIYEYDDSKDENYSEVKTEGCDGEAVLTLRTTFTDGMQTECIETERKITKEPVDEVIVVGTLPVEEEVYEESSDDYYASGSFAWPVPYTSSVTSYYGPRWGSFLYGIDIADSGIYGEAIVASDSGTVVETGYDDYGYGYYVIVDHGNGYSTLYGHCSEIAVYDGESVYQGQTVAYVGSTGRSTGPHLHFEISYGSDRLDPMTFL